ncbi:MAG: hypothetical protein Q7V62_10330, partial [Actinomycetota bacterium]|nr:hypothetical protein [Actinomycetota bacterium]
MPSKYAIVGDKPASGGLHVACAFLFTLIAVVAVSLLASGAGTDTETGYYFGIGDSQVALEGRGWTRAEAMVPIFCVVLSMFHVWAYLYRDWYASKPGALEVLGPLVVACVVTPLQMAQLAVLARIGDAQLVTALVFLAL